jgi:subtilisin family serine protease
LKTFYHQHLSTPHPKNRSTQVIGTKKEEKKMKSKKNYFFTVSMIFLVLSISLALWAVEDGLYDSSLSKTLLKKGYAPVMVKLAVPDIEELTALSTAYITGISDQAYIQAAYDADLSLERAISLTRDSLLHRLNGSFYKVNRTFTTLPYLAITVNADTLERLSKIPEVLSVVEDKVIHLSNRVQSVPVGPDPPLLSQSVGIVGADLAWGYGFTGAGWYVAILDTGILSSHEMFQGKDLVEQCYAQGDDLFDGEIGDCPNGLIEMSGPGAAAPLKNMFGHGTSVAGIAAGNNHSNRFGVARDANIIAIQAFSYHPDEDDASGVSSDILKSLEYVYTLRNTYKIASVNMSFGAGRYYSFCDDDYLKAVIDNLRNAGIASVIAAGNEGYCDSISSPACISTTVAVGGTTKQDTEYLSGNWNDLMVDLLAPAQDITSSNATGDSNYSTWTGTSMAAPHVAGAWAILKQYDATMSTDEILTLLQSSGLPITNTHCQGTIPKPRLNVGNAISTLLPLTPPSNISAQQVANRSLLRTEYINKLTWESNPLNAGKNVTQYKIYLVQGAQWNFLVQVNSSTFEYLHRDVEKRQELTYAITAVDNQGQESLPRYYTLEF